MGNVTNAQFIVLLIAVLGSQLGSLYYLSGRIDRISDDLKHFYRDLGRHEEAIDQLKSKSS